MKNSRIIGTGSYLPKQVFTNNQLCEIIDSNDEWIYTRTGIKERRFSSDLNTSDLATKAAMKAINDAGIEVDDVDVIIVATMSADNTFPSVASMVQGNLNMKPTFAFDVNAACSGFMFALNIAVDFIETGKYKNILVIGAEVMSKILDFRDRNTCILFGDGAGALILTQTTDNRMFDIKCVVENDNENLVMKNSGLKTPYEDKKLFNEYMYMNGREIFKFATKVIKDEIQSITSKNHININDIQTIIPHQANSRIIEKAAKSLNIREDVFYSNIEKYGNTSAASIPIALDEAIKNHNIKRDDYIIMIGFGAGLTYGTALIKY